MKRVLGTLLALCMLCSVFPLSLFSFAAEEGLQAAAEPFDYGSLYVPGAIVDLRAFDGSKITINANGSGTWTAEDGCVYPLQGSNNGSYTAGGVDYTTGWQTVSGGGVGFNLSRDYINNGGTGHFIDLSQKASSVSFDDDYTVEIVASFRGMQSLSAELVELWQYSFINTANVTLFVRHGYKKLGSVNANGTMPLDGLCWEYSANAQFVAPWLKQIERGDLVSLNRVYTNFLTVSVGRDTVAIDSEVGGHAVSFTTDKLTAGADQFRLMNNLPSTVYAVRVYERALNKAELAQNHFADIAIYYSLDMSGYAALSSVRQQAALSLFIAAFADVEIGTTTKGAAQGLVDAALAEASLVDDYESYALLYAQNGLKTLLFAYHDNDVTVKIGENGSGTWKSRTEDAALYTLAGKNDGSYTAGVKDYTTGWQKVSGGGVGFNVSRDYLSGGGTGHFVDLSSQIDNAQYNDSYTVETVMTPRGLHAIDAQLDNERWEYGLIQSPNFYVYTRHSYRNITELPANRTMPLDNIYLGYSANGSYNGSPWRDNYNNPSLNIGTLYTLTVSQAVSGDAVTVLTHMDGYTGTDPVREFSETVKTASGNNLRVLNNVPATVYSVRFYDRAITESERIQNHFADVATANRLEIDFDIFLSLPALAQRIVHEAMKDYEIFGEDKAELQEAFDEAYASALQAADVSGLVSFGGISARLEGENGFRTLWNVDLAKLAELEEMYDVRYGAILGVGSYYGINYVNVEDLTVVYDAQGKPIPQATESCAVLVYDTDADNKNATRSYTDYNAELNTASYAYTAVYGDSGAAGMTDAAKYKLKYVCRAFVTLTDKVTGNATTMYVDGINETFAEEDQASLEEVAVHLLANGYESNANLKAVTEKAKEYVEYKDMTIYEYYAKWINPNTCPMNFELVSSVTIPSPKAGVPAVVLNHMLVDLGVQHTKFEVSYAYPLVDEPTELPAIMMIHGASQNLDNYATAIIYAAQCGYVAMAHDQPSITNSQVGVTGTDGDFRVKDTRFINDTNPMKNTLTSTVAAGLTAFHMLQSGAGLIDADGNSYTKITVDKDNIGITGISWGGWSTAMMGVLLGDQVKAIAPKYLCGNNTLNSFAGSINTLTPEVKAIWLKFFDPGMYASNLKAYLLVEEASKDTFGYPASINKFYTEAMGGDCPGAYLTNTPNDNHYITNVTVNGNKHQGILGGTYYITVNSTTLPGGVRYAPNNTSYLEFNHNELAFFDHFLKGENYAPSLVFIDYANTAKQSDGSLKVTFTVETAEMYPEEGGIKLFYSPSGDAWNATDKLWSFVMASTVSQDVNTETGLYVHTYTATIPASVAGASLEFFAYFENAELGSTNCSNVHSYNASSGSVTVTGGYTIPQR